MKAVCRKCLVVASFLCAGFSTLGYAQTEAATPPVLGRLVDVAGVRVHIYCTGEGNPTVVVASGGFSFDWGLVQPKIAAITRICTYDPAGTAWSDRPAARANAYCSDRVDELHQLLINAGLRGSYVLVGYSIGGLVARLYAARYPSETAGMVFVDHAFIDLPDDFQSRTPASSFDGADSPPVLISKSPVALDLEDDENFSKLPGRDQRLHRWALLNSFRPTPEMAGVCFSEVADAEKKTSFPLGNKPEAVVSTSYDAAAYSALQQKLMALSKNSEEYKAEESSHMVIIDQPDVVIRAIQEVVATVERNRAAAK